MKICVRLLSISIVWLLSGFSFVYAGNVTLPYEFSAGQTALASEVNGNFKAIERAVDDNDNRISALEDAMDVDAANSYKAYLRLAGKTQGEISGSVTEAGHEDSIRVLSTSHEVACPIENGQLTGKRQHSPFVITKETDKSTPHLYNLLINNEIITSWRLDFYEPSRTGQMVNTYSIQLENARISDIQHEKLSNEKETEKISFVYGKITWIWMDGGVTAEDFWETPVI